MEFSLSQICELLGDCIEKYNSIPKKRKLIKSTRPMTSTPIAGFSAKKFSPNFEFSVEKRVTTAYTQEPVKSTPRKRAVRRTVGLRARKLVFEETEDEAVTVN